MTFDRTTVMSASGIVPPAGPTPPDSTESVKDYVTLNDFVGLVPGTVDVPPGFASVIHVIGATPANVNHADSAVPNLTVYRIEGKERGNQSFTFSVESTFGPSTPNTSPFVIDATKDDPDNASSDRKYLSSIGRVETPAFVAGGL